MVRLRPCPLPVSPVFDFAEISEHVLTGSNYLVLQGFPAPRLESLWRDFMRRADTPPALAAPEYFHEPSCQGRNPFAVLAVEHGAITGVLTGIHQGKHVLCGLPSRPQLCLDSAAAVDTVSHALWDGVLAEVRDAKLVDVFTWAWNPLLYFEQHGFKVRQIEANVVLDLTAGADALFKQFHETRRRNIRAALRHNIEVSEAISDEDRSAYYAVFSAWRQTQRKVIRANGSLARAKKIQKLEMYRRFLARYQGKVIAATTVRFYPGGLIEYASNCSMDEFLNLRPNDLLLWSTIEWACQQGFKKYSLGASHPFLRKYGGIVVPTYRYRLDRTFLHRNNIKDALTDAGRKIWRKLPSPAAVLIRKALRTTVQFYRRPGN